MFDDNVSWAVFGDSLSWAVFRDSLWWQWWQCFSQTNPSQSFSGEKKTWSDGCASCYEGWFCGVSFFVFKQPVSPAFTELARWVLNVISSFGWALGISWTLRCKPLGPVGPAPASVTVMLSLKSSDSKPWSDKVFFNTSATAQHKRIVLARPNHPDESCELASIWSFMFHLNILSR